MKRMLWIILVSTLSFAQPVKAGYLWVPNYGDDTVSKVDASTHQVVTTIPVGDSPCGIAVDSNNVYVTHRREPYIYVVDKFSDQIIRTIDVSAAMAFALGVAVDSEGYIYAVGRVHMDWNGTDDATLAKINNLGEMVDQRYLTNIDVDDENYLFYNVSIGIGINKNGVAYIPWKRAYATHTGVFVIDTQDLSGENHDIPYVTYGYRGPSVGIDRDGNGWTVGERNTISTITKCSLEQGLTHYANPCTNPLPGSHFGVAVDVLGKVFAGGSENISMFDELNVGSSSCIPVDAVPGGMSCDSFGYLWVTFPTENEVRKYNVLGIQVGNPVEVGSTPLGFGDMTGFEFFDYDTFYGPDLSVNDVPDDQGGFLQLSWTAFPTDASGLPDSVVTYEAQRNELGGWTTLTTIEATQADSYQVTIPTTDIFTIGQPEPFSQYRVVVNSSNPSVFYFSAVDSAYSIDNIAPPAPDAFLIEGEGFRLVVCSDPEIPDLGEVCFYKGQTSGFIPDTPVQCSPDLIFNEPHHLVNAYYRVQFMDIHGNLSEFSEEVTLADPSGVGDSVPLVFGIEQNFPNPFNPSTTIKFGLRESLPVTLRVYDMSGKLIRDLISGQVMEAGLQEKVWNGKDDHGQSVSAGIYFYKLTAGEFSETKRMALVK